MGRMCGAEGRGRRLGNEKRGLGRMKEDKWRDGERIRESVVVRDEH